MIALVTSPTYLEHDTRQHVESAARLAAVYQYLDELGLRARLPAINPRPATDDDLLAVHTARHLRLLRSLAARGGGMIDPDTVLSPRSEEVARLAAGGALAALDAVIAGGQDAGGPAAAAPGRGAGGADPPARPDAAFVLARPPGHHAMAERAMGFCLYNSIAVAARYAQRVYGLRRVLVLDWDVHHGNGTQSLFEDDPSVLFISLHQYPLWPPRWGWLDQIGTGTGAGFTVNVPLPPGEGDDGYALACVEVVQPIARAFKPELVLVSAGQDGHIADPISRMGLSAGGFAALARLARAIATEAGAYGPVLLLEGGYNPTTLPYLVGAILAALDDLGLAIEDPYARHIPVSSEARARLDMVTDALRPYWNL